MRVESFNPNRFDQTFEDVAVERLIEAAEVVAKAARRRCKVETGELRNSIRITRKMTKSGRAFSKKKSARIYAGSKDAFYATAVEYGTSRAAPHPFMRPALEESMSEVKEILGVK